MQLIRVIRELRLGRVLILSLCSVPLGVIVGLAELMFGMTLMYFFSSVDLISYKGLPRWFIIKDYLGPTAAFISMGLFRVFMNFFSITFNNTSSMGFLLKVRNNVVESILLSKTPSQTFSLSDLNNFFSHLLPISSTFISSVLSFLTAAFTIVFLFSSLFLLSFKLAVVTVITVLLAGIPVILTRDIRRKYGNIYTAQGNNFFKKITIDLKNIYFLQIIGKLLSEFKSLIAINYSILTSGIKLELCYMINGSLPYGLAIFVALAIIMANQKYGFVHNSVLLPFVYLLMQVNTNVGKLFTANGNIQFSRPSFIELTGILSRAKLNRQDYNAEAGKFEVDTISSLEVSNLSIGRDTTILTDISFCANPGDFLCISGKSGIGKTTLLMTLIGVIPHKSGTVTINGYEVSDINFLKFREKLAFSGPEPFLLDDTIRANLLFGTKAAHSDVELIEALKLAHCGFVMEEMPEGLNSVLYESGEGISAGQKQRLSIARAILRSPEILILDEATANIDEETEEKIITGIKTKFPRLLTLAVSHRASMRQHATRIIEL
ncbi:ATP-binding cassette domain-containing protein [Candidatus Magnetomonas plexicatena]|uniref:ATP-binding cassette domain-containing protein n=1 Tax=Candidatus Magnetomonas plexicatena TaxID=2552947 RepID=UPI001C7742E6|nr:ABC transporter ATP-binding protein [Nitrospirales bacterium LBB_01]